MANTPLIFAGFPIGAIGPFEARAPLGHRERHAGVKLSTLADVRDLVDKPARTIPPQADLAACLD